MVHRFSLLGFAAILFAQFNSACDSQSGDSARIDSRQALSASATSPLVFDWGYYLQRYPDLGVSNIDGEEKARNHWLTYGIAEGRQGSQEFCAKDYLETNADIRAQHGTNYAGAIEHYVAYGASEGRLGAPFDRLVFDWRYYGAVREQWNVLAGSRRAFLRRQTLFCSP